jgi:phosphomannomutase
MEKIKFGTDGWRGVIAENFTFRNVRRVSAAIAKYLAAKAVNKPLVTIGYDARFSGRAFAETVGTTLAGNGCDVILTDKILSTPAVSSSVLDNKADLGIMISASHNPPEFNGIKIKARLGCSATPELTDEIEKLIDDGENIAQGEITERRDLTAKYFERLNSFAEIKNLKSSKLRVVFDPMHGAGAGYLPHLLKKTSIKIETINGDQDPMFGGLSPEPIEKNLSLLKKTVVSSGAACGLAVDGDADRIAVVDDRGNYLTPHRLFPLILYYLCGYKKLKGKVVQALSLGYLSRRIAEDFGLEFEETPVGFKFISERLAGQNVLMGGEESGGFGYGGYLPERDGLLNSLTVIQMLHQTKKSLSALLNEMEKKYGRSNYIRTDFKNPGISKEDFVRMIKGNLEEKAAGLKIKKVKDFDGIELTFEDDSWLLLRPSGTEPIIRVYSESDNKEKTRRIIDWGRKLVTRTVLQQA